MCSNESPKNNNTQSLGEQIEIATQALERNLGFISNCDNKASIILTAVGVLITGFLLCSIQIVAMIISLISWSRIIKIKILKVGFTRIMIIITERSILLI